MINKDYEIVRGRVELKVPHENGRTAFVSPAKGPGNYVDVQGQITKEGLRAPNFAETASLVYTANQNKNEPEFAQILDNLDNQWLWAFTGNRYVKNKGVYIKDNPEIVNGRVVIENESELQRKIKAGDKSVRFVSFGFKIGEQTASQLAKNPYVIGLAGKEGAEKLAEVSGRYNHNPKVWSFENVDEEIAGVSSLVGCDGGLYVGGNYCGDYDDGCALGIIPAERKIA